MNSSPTELTVRAVALGIVLAVIMGGANAYLGLKAGQTVSACIPSAIVSMAVLRRFRNSSILENNLVQTIASAGESIAAASAFTLPALIFMKGALDWKNVFLSTALGGLLGVLFSVPLRRVLIIDAKMPFPEGVATAEVLKAGHAHDSKEATAQSAKILMMGSLASFVLGFCQTGLRWMSHGFHGGFKIGNALFVGDIGFSTAIMGSGFLMGLPACLGFAFGGLFTWFVLVPIAGIFFGIPEAAGSVSEMANTLWSSKVRPMGVGLMIIGGLTTLFNLFGPLKRAFSFGMGRRSDQEKDLSTKWVVFGIGAIASIVAIIAGYALSGSLNGVEWIGASLMVTVLLMAVATLCSVVAGYSVGLAGTTALPISALAIISVLMMANILCWFLPGSEAGPWIVFICTFVGCAASLSGDNLQDLKSGHLVGATPWKQQVLLMVGVLASALVMASVLDLLFNAYGFGNVLPREGMDPTQALACPKGAMIATLIQSLCDQSIDFILFKAGAAMGIFLLAINGILKILKLEIRIPILGVGLGMYFPLEIVATICAGAWIRSLVEKKRSCNDQGVLLAAGLVAGESMSGLLLAIPFVIFQKTDLFALPWFGSEVQTLLGALFFMGCGVWMYRIGTRSEELSEKNKN